MTDFWTLEAFENAGIKELTIEGKKVVIKAVDPKLLIVLFGNVKESAESTIEDTLKNLDALDEVLINGLVTPSVTKETVNKIGRFKQELALEITKFSGLNKGSDVEEFRKESDSVNG